MPWSPIHAWAEPSSSARRLTAWRRGRRGENEEDGRTTLPISVGLFELTRLERKEGECRALENYLWDGRKKKLFCHMSASESQLSARFWHVNWKFPQTFDHASNQQISFRSQWVLRSLNRCLWTLSQSIPLWTMMMMSQRDRERERESSLCGASVQVGQLHALMINILMQEISLNATKKKEMWNRSISDISDHTWSS